MSEPSSQWTFCPWWDVWASPFYAQWLRECLHTGMCVYVCVCVCVHVLSRVWLFATPWTVARQAPLTMGFSRQGCWSGSPCPPPGDLPNAGTAISLPLAQPRKPGKSMVSSYLFPFFQGLQSCIACYLMFLKIVVSCILFSLLICAEKTGLVLMGSRVNLLTFTVYIMSAKGVYSVLPTFLVLLKRVIYCL